ncbi:MAG TPA: FtsX-like permease family protein [Gemmatimonadales bacterium]|nr:FtsX-like permease family protein [Gemmatimonadales bacterium]
MPPGWALRNLARHPLRTALSLLGIAVSSAMLLDMVLLSGGIERSFERLLRGRGYQVRLAIKGTLPFDTEATIPGIAGVLDTVRRTPGVEAAGAVLGASLHGRRGDSLVTLFGYGVEPGAQALYQLERGADLAADDTLGLLLGRPAARLLGAAIGDTVVLVGRLDPQLGRTAVERRLVVRGLVRWLYDYRDQPSIGTVLPVMQALAGHAGADRASFVVVRVGDGASVAAVVDHLRRALPRIEVNSVAELVERFRERLVYFRQLSYILGTVSLAVTLLLVVTLMTITVNERTGEIAALRAIGVGRATIVRQVLVEGTTLTVAGAAAGVVLGALTARYLDAILTSFPGLPAAISFFVPEPRSLAVAGAVLLLAGALAGGYPAFLAARAPIAATLREEAT